MSYKQLYDSLRYDIDMPDELLEFAMMQRMYEDGLWKNPNYYVNEDDYFAHFFLNFSMKYSNIKNIEELIISYELKGMTFLNSIDFVNWMRDIAIKLVVDSVKRQAVSIGTKDLYVNCINEMYKNLKNILQQ